MIFSLPNYHRFSEANLERLHLEDDQMSSSRVARMSFNILLLAGLWGVPLYARWQILSVTNRSEPIVGKWRATDGSHFQIAFTKDGQFVLSWKEIIVETTRWWFREDYPDEVVLADFAQSGEQAIAQDRMFWFRVSLTGEKLSTNFAIDHEAKRLGFRLGRIWKFKGESLALPSAGFERVK